MTQIVSGNASLPVGFSGLTIVQNATGAPITIVLPATPTVGQVVRGVDDAGNAGANSIHWQSADGSPIESRFDNDKGVKEGSKADKARDKKDGLLLIIAANRLKK
jgi:hypothetical protein